MRLPNRALSCDCPPSKGAILVPINGLTFNRLISSCACVRSAAVLAFLPLPRGLFNIRAEKARAACSAFCELVLPLGMFSLAISDAAPPPVLYTLLMSEMTAVSPCFLAAVFIPNGGVALPKLTQRLRAWMRNSLAASSLVFPINVSSAFLSLVASMVMDALIILTVSPCHGYQTQWRDWIA